MTMFPILNVPALLPEWATNGTYVDEPLPGNKADGFKPGYQPPAKWWNWVFNLNYQWAKIPLRSVLMNWWEEAAISADDVEAAVFHPDIGYWITGMDATAPYGFYSVDGHTWTAFANTIGAAAAPNFGGIDTSYYILGNTSNDIKYSADAGQTAWSTVASATIGGAGTLTRICTKYPASDFAIVGRANGTLRIASTGITGSWASPTTPPPSIPVGAGTESLIYISGSTWLLLITRGGNGEDARLYKSVDDGDNWVVVAGLTFPVGQYGPTHMAYDGDTGRLIICGGTTSISPEEYFAYSDDLGDTWTAAVVDRKGLGSDSPAYRIYYCGGGAWIATNYKITISEGDGFFMSTDNGENWEMCDSHGATNTQGNRFCCDGRKMLCFGDAGFSAYTLAT